MKCFQHLETIHVHACACQPCLQMNLIDCGKEVPHAIQRTLVWCKIKLWIVIRSCRDSGSQISTATLSLKFPKLSQLEKRELLGTPLLNLATRECVVFGSEAT